MVIANRMIKQFKLAYNELTQIIIEKKLKGVATGSYQQALFRCEDIINKLYMMVGTETDKAVKEDFGGLNNDLQIKTSQIIAQNESGDLIKAIYNSQRVVEYVIGRLADDTYRTAGIVGASLINNGGFGVQFAQKFLTEALEEQKITSFVDKLGRTWSLDVYTNMVIRTTSRQCRNAGMLTKDDHDLYYVVPIGSTCPICRNLEGRVYSKSGTSKYYPPMTELYGKIDENGANDLTNSYLNIHPNCRHTLVKWTELGLDEKEIEEMREKSSFEKHPKVIDDKNYKGYNEYRKGQKEKARFRNYLNEYKEMQSEGIDVPRNFQRFIENREYETKKYKAWKEELKGKIVKEVIEVVL